MVLNSLLKSVRRISTRIINLSLASIVGFSSLVAATPLLFVGHAAALALEVGTGQPNAYATIQSAINAANPGDTVDVAAGIYIEQLTIDKDITLIGAGDTTVIQSPNTLASTFAATINGNVSPMKPIITIMAADANISALKVDGNAKGDSVNNTFFVGIGFYNAGGSLDHVTVTGVKETPVSRDYQGDAVRATDDNVSLHTLSITNSIISDFQKNGITLSGSGLTVAVSGNHVTGSGAIDLVAQNGIVLGTGVTGSVTGNTVSELMCNDSTCGSDWYTKVQAIAIALVGVGSKTVSGNFVSNSDIGIYNELASGLATITNNTLTNNRWFGMLFEAGDVAVSGGSVTGGEIGIFNPLEHNSGSTTVHNVSISGNSIAGLKNDAVSFSVDATNNWWGNVSGPGNLTNVTTSPWCTNDTCSATQSAPTATAEVLSTSTPSGTVTVTIPAGTTVTANGLWDGIINPPTVTTVVIPATPGFANTIGLAFSVGSNSVTLTFDQGVRMVLPGQVGKHVGFIVPGGSFTEITSVCSDDTQTVGNALPVSGACKINVGGGNLIVWTKHFTKFVTYTQTKVPTYTVVAGDTLSGIGANVGVDWPLIASLNGISAPYTIYPGQVLQLPAGTVVAAATTTTASPQSDNSAVLGESSNPQIGTAVSTVVSKPAVVASTTKKANWLNWYWFAAGAAVALLAVIYYIYRAADKKS